MGKRKPKLPEQKRIDILMATVFEGDSCKAVSIINPYVSPLQLVCLGEKLEQLGYLMIDQEKAQKRLNSFSKAIHDLMGGRTP